MKRFLMGALLSGALMLPAQAALKNGDAAPDFTTAASLAGEEFTFSLKDALAKGPVVLYFYPAAYTRGCNIEARSFADNADKFAAAGATVIGVSQDGIQKLLDYSADPEYCAGKFAVASDVDGKITRSFDLETLKIDREVTDTRGTKVTHALTERTTFVITPDAKVIATLSSEADDLAAHEHAEKSLAIVEGLKK